MKEDIIKAIKDLNYEEQQIILQLLIKIADKSLVL